MLNLLTEPLLRAVLRNQGSFVLSLPEVYQALACDEVESFAALRPHQRHPWHALLCQLGALACLKAGLAEPPMAAPDWAAILRGLTPGFPGDEPWRLVSPSDEPAFLQPVVGPGVGFKPLATPDELDMLVTAKNHDLKGSRMAVAKPDDWLFALLALQTAEGFLGAGNFGASRMNGGFANRPGVGLAPPGGIGNHVLRDIRRLIALEGECLDAHVEYDPDGPALIWLEPWDGAASRSRRGLHPYYVEICRRVRLTQSDGVLAARTGNSKAARIAMTKDEAGVTGDPWTPVASEEGKRKALTVDARGFSYRRLSDILFGRGFDPAPLQTFGPGESGEGWSLLCRAITRGQGKTEGYHERRVPIPAPIVRRFKAGELAAIETLSKTRIAEAGTVRTALRFALMVLFQNGPERSDFKPQDPSSARRAELFLGRFGRAVDADFFEGLFVEASKDAEDQREAVRRAWLGELRGKALGILREARSGAPTSAVRRHRATVRAESAFDRTFYNAKDLKRHFERSADAA